MTYMDSIIDCCDQLTKGWSERIEFSVIVGGATELRAQSVQHGALLGQLHVMAWEPGSIDPNGGGNPNKSGSRPPVNMAPLYLIDDIVSELGALHLKLWGEVHTEPAAVGVKRPVIDVMRAVVGMCATLEHVHPHLLADAERKFRGWVKRARVMLDYDRPMVMLRDTVCGTCGGALVVASDASTDVRCVGYPDTDPQAAEEPCGMLYRRAQWIDLL